MLVNGIEGEGLFNDATALVAYKVAVGGVVGGTFSIADAGLRFLAGAAGGDGDRPGRRLGHRRAAGADERRADQRDDLAVQRLRGVHPGQRRRRIGRAGRGHHRPVHGDPGPSIIPARIRLQGNFMWEMLDFILNASLFVLVGLQLRGVVDRLGDGPGRDSSSRTRWRSARRRSLIRLVWFFTMPYLIRLLDRRPSQVARRVGARQRLVLAWSRHARRRVARRRAGIAADDGRRSAVPEP